MGCRNTLWEGVVGGCEAALGGLGGGMPRLLALTTLKVTISVTYCQVSNMVMSKLKWSYIHKITSYSNIHI